MRILLTGGAGFIGFNFVSYWLANDPSVRFANIDKLTYAGNPASLERLASYGDRHTHHKVDICDGTAVRAVFESFKPDVVIHFAAESHVDRSIDGPGEFIQTNINGTFTLLQESLRHFESLDAAGKAMFRFHHVSTDEVFGSLGDTGYFSETTAYDPRSPYSSSKAASDHLVRAWYHTYGLPVVLTNCSNNYGAFHFPEKLIPLMILKLHNGKPLPVYGDGLNVRDWLYVEDHVRALMTVLRGGRSGETYCVGGGAEMKNIDVVNTLISVMDADYPHPEIKDRTSLITYVEDRKGHDRRYAIDASKLHTELGWAPQESFESGIRKTVKWYMENRSWWEPLLKNFK
jgi:dTDP-glucose 4,6-dehydratase